MKRLILILIALAAISLSLTSCVTKKKCDQKYPPQIVSNDSIIEKTTIIYRDTVVHDTIPGDSIFVEVTAECDPKTGKLLDKPYSKVHSDNFVDVMFGIFKNSPMIKVIRKPIYRDYLFQKIYAEKLSNHYKNSTKVVIVTETKTPIWNWILIGFLIAFIFYLIIKH